MNTQEQLLAPPAPAKPKRKLRPEVAARFTAKAVQSELAELWDETPSGPTWRQSISRLRAVLAPQSNPQEEALFDI